MILLKKYYVLTIAVDPEFHIGVMTLEKKGANPIYFTHF